MTTPQPGTTAPPLALLMSYVRCPDCRHQGADHPKRGEDRECIGGYLNPPPGAPAPRCGCQRRQVGR